MEFAMSIVVEKMEEWQCNKIFLSTEDKNIVQAFKQVFGDLCVTTNRKYVNYELQRDIAVTRSRIDRDNDHFLQGKEYLTELVLLSTLKSLVTSQSSGSTGLMMLAENFENFYVFNLGKYGMIGLD